MKNNVSATIEFFRALKAKNLRSRSQVLDILRTRLPEPEVKAVIEHINEEKYWGNFTKEEFESMEDFRNASYERTLAISLVPYYSRMREVLSMYEERKGRFGRRILDVGCRNGIQTCFVAYLNPESEVVGIDSLPAGLPHGERVSKELGISNVRFDNVSLGDLQAGDVYDTIVLTRPLARNGLMESCAKDRLSFFDSARECSRMYAPLARAVSSHLEDGGRLFLSDVFSYDDTFLGILLAFAEEGLAWKNTESNRGNGFYVEDGDPVQRVNGYDLLFVKESVGSVSCDEIVAAFKDDANCREVEGRPGFYEKEDASVMCCLHAGEVLDGFTSRFDYDDGSEDRITFVAWKDRQDECVWLESKWNDQDAVFRLPVEKRDWICGEVAKNARIIAADAPDVFQRLSGRYGELKFEDVADVREFVAQERADVKSDRNGGVADVQPSVSEIFGILPGLKDFGDAIKRGDDPRHRKSNTPNMLSALMKKDHASKERDLPGDGFYCGDGFQTLRPKGVVDGRPRRQRVERMNQVQTPSQGPAGNDSAPAGSNAIGEGPSDKKLRLTFISKSGRLNVENMETGCQWRVDSSGVRIDDESVGHVSSRNIEDTDFTMTTSPGQIVMRDESCGYEFTIRLA